MSFSTKPKGEHRSWCFTEFPQKIIFIQDEKKLMWNELPKEEQDKLEQSLRKRWLVWKNVIAVAETTKYLVMGFEKCPTTGRPHIQGYISFTSSLTFDRLHKRCMMPKSVHVEPANGSPDQNAKYCTKDVYVGETFEWGEKPNQGKRSDLSEVCILLKTKSLSEVAIANPTTFAKFHNGLKYLKEIIDMNDSKHIRDVTCTVIWGESGAGKSHYVWNSSNLSEIYALNPGNSGNVWFSSYEGQKTLLLDEFTCKSLPFKYLLKILDKYPLQLETKGGNTWARWTKVFILSNEKPEKWYQEINLSDWKCLARRLTETFTMVNRKLILYEPKFEDEKPYSNYDQIFRDI